MSVKLVFVLVAIILIIIVIYRNAAGENFYKYLSTNFGQIYDKIAPYSYKYIRKRIKELGQEYTPQQYLWQIFLFAGAAAIITFFYFYSIIISII